MRPWRPQLLASLVVAAVTLAATPSHAHPAGAASVNRFLNFEYTGDAHFRVAYLIDFAEGPAYAEVDALDADHDGSVTPEEQRRYLNTRLPVLMSSWVIEVDGERVRPTVVASHLDTSPGEGGLETLRIACELAAFGPLPTGGSDVTLHVKDDTFAAQPGWREIMAADAPEPDGALGHATVAGPTDAGYVGRAPRVSEARFTFHPRMTHAASWGKRSAAMALGVAGLAILAFFAARRRHS